MKNTTKELKVLNIEKCKKLSVNGNPSYYITVQDENGNEFTGRTASDSSLGYAVSYGWENTKRVFTYHATKNGNIIFTY